MLDTVEWVEHYGSGNLKSEQLAKVAARHGDLGRGTN